MATAILATLGFFFVSTPVSARPEEHDIKRLVDTWDIPGAIETTRLFVRLAGERQKPIPVFTNSLEEMVEMKEKETG